MARTEKFCTQRCMNIWVASSESNLKDEEVMDVDGVATTEVVTQQRKVARALKHLQIDMACRSYLSLSISLSFSLSLTSLSLSFGSASFSVIRMYCVCDTHTHIYTHTHL